jgi:hypothetical protein
MLNLKVYAVRRILFFANAVKSHFAVILGLKVWIGQNWRYVSGPDTSYGDRSYS